MQGALRVGKQGELPLGGGCCDGGLGHARFAPVPKRLNDHTAQRELGGQLGLSRLGREALTRPPHIITKFFRGLLD